ncbi:MAG TPA: HlyD family efflux transporter periplasmic adaptor subunit [Pirellula sp.]|nr:HlyD family efflux transporter periplasmic adaptor subunit [Pirellula sp.]
MICLLQGNLSAQSVINRGLAAADKQGVLEPYKDTEVATAEMGVVRELFVKLGDVIEEKSAIGRLDNEQQRFLVHEAELDANAFGMLETARREVDFNNRRVDETSKSVSAGKSSPKELERHRLDLSIAKAKLQAQEEAKLVSHARLEKAQLMLHERTIRAPHRGTVVTVYRDVGEYIAGNAPAIIRLVDTSKLRARFYLSDEAAQRFRKTRYAEVRLANHVIVKAEIEFVAPFAIADGHVIEMTVIIENEDEQIRSSSCELVQS